MRVLSFDVGIKNLAYCVLEKIEDIKIIDWGIINLSEESDIKCEHILTNKKQCENKVLNLIKYEDKEIVICNNHKKKYQPKLEKKNILYKCNKCDKLSTYYINIDDRICWCDDHVEKESKKYMKTIKIKKIKNKNCAKTGLQILAIKLYKILDNKRFENIDDVLIENQPSFKNPTMKTLSTLLYGYFVIRKLDNNCKYDVKFMSPSNKLKVNEESNDILENTNATKIYTITKKLSIKYCSTLINDEEKEILKKYKKKDDLCDAYLQGFYYIYPIIPKRYSDKLKEI